MQLLVLLLGFLPRHCFSPSKPGFFSYFSPPVGRWVLNFVSMQGASVQDQQDMVVRVLTTIAGPAVPPVYKLFMAPWPWAPFLTAFFTPPFFKVFAALFRRNNRQVTVDGTLLNLEDSNRNITFQSETAAMASVLSSPYHTLILCSFFAFLTTPSPRLLSPKVSRGSKPA